MKKIYILMILALSMQVIDISVYANSAPPMNVGVTILNLDDSYEIDLLIPFNRELTESDFNTAQERILSFENDSYGRYYQENYPSYLIQFQDKDGYVSNTLYGDSDYFWRNNNDFGLQMRIPRIFKIVLIKNNEQLIISETIEMQAYDERFTWNLEGITFGEDIMYDVGIFDGLNENPFRESRPYQELAVRIVITIIIEFIVFYLLGYRLKQTYLFYGILNVTTQTLLTLGLLYGTFLGSGMFGNFLLLIVGEIIVFGSEMGINGLVIKEKYTAHIVFSTFLANLASLILGTIITLQLYRILL